MGTLTGAQKKRLIEGLSAAYPSYQHLDELLDLELDRRLADVVAPTRLGRAVLQLINTADREGWLPALVTAATLQNPGNAELRGAVAGIGLDTDRAVDRLLAEPAGPARDLLPAGGALADLPGPELQRMVNAAAGFQNAVVFAAALLARVTQVCRVELVTRTEVSSGTGFLVGPDLVLTNHHVVEPVLPGGPAAGGLRCRFDYHLRADGSVHHGTAHEVAADWLVAASPPSPVDRQTAPTRPPSPDELDYALLRLATTPGLDPVPGRGRRGWVDLRTDPVQPVVGQPLLILQHPADNPCKIAQDTAGVLGVNANRTRITYGVNTLRGSSGSPCFTFDLTPVALHHAGAAEFDYRRNQGVPLVAIAARLHATPEAAPLLGG